MKKTIEIKCKAADTLELEKLTELQGNLKDLSNENYEKLKNQILTHGFSFPFHVWKNSNKNYILDGHQRRRVVSKLQSEEGYYIPKLPVSYIEAENKKEAKEKLLACLSEYGNMTPYGLYEFMGEDIDFSELDNFRLPEIDIDKFESEFFGGHNVDGGGVADGVVPYKGDNIRVRLFFHPGLWIGKREEVLMIIEKMKKTYDCEVKIDD